MVHARAGRGPVLKPSILNGRGVRGFMGDVFLSQPKPGPMSLERLSGTYEAIRPLLCIRYGEGFVN